MIRRPPRSTLFPTRRSSDLASRYLTEINTRRVAPSSEDVARLQALGAPLPQGPSDPSQVLDRMALAVAAPPSSEEPTSELQSPHHLVCHLHLDNKSFSSQHR